MAIVVYEYEPFFNFFSFVSPFSLRQEKQTTLFLSMCCLLPKFVSSIYLFFLPCLFYYFGIVQSTDSTVNSYHQSSFLSGFAKKLKNMYLLFFSSK